MTVSDRHIKENGIMKEHEIEEKLRKAVRQKGGLCWKFVSPGNAGVPDRIALMQKGKVAFVEVKAPGETMRPLQEKRKRQLESLGFKVFCLDSVEDIPKVISEIEGSDDE